MSSKEWKRRKKDWARREVRKNRKLDTYIELTARNDEMMMSLHKATVIDRIVNCVFSRATVYSNIWLNNKVFYWCFFFSNEKLCSGIIICLLPVSITIYAAPRFKPFRQRKCKHQIDVFHVALKMTSIKKYSSAINRIQLIRNRQNYAQKLFNRRKKYWASAMIFVSSK